MKLIIKQYLAGLKEREELDALIPDLLSQMGLTVFSRPRRGTRQDGVDVGAAGRIDEGEEKVYLFSIKSGNLTRYEWNSNSVQSLRPSLESIIDGFIPNRLPKELAGKPIVICLAFGGDVNEQVRAELTQYTKRNTRNGISFEEWNGDKISALVMKHLLNENLMLPEVRDLFRKSLALLDEPDASFSYFSKLIEELNDSSNSGKTNDLTALRQICLCVWTLFSWARDAENLESAYLSSELALLHAWTITQRNSSASKGTKELLNQAFSSLFEAYQRIASAYLQKTSQQVCLATHALSSAVEGHCSVDVNLKLFDHVGRVALDGIWSIWHIENSQDLDEEQRDSMQQGVTECAETIVRIVTSNPTLRLPVKDDQAIDIWLAAFILFLKDPNFLGSWIEAMLRRANFTLKSHGQYPSIHRDYEYLITHPAKRDDQYRKESTAASVLYPILGTWSCLLKNQQLYRLLAELQENVLSHCCMQVWHPGPESENHFYKNDAIHGVTHSSISFNCTPTEYLAHVFGECDQVNDFENLSATKNGMWPLILLACRHHRLPPPLHLLKGFLSSSVEGETNGRPNP